MTCPCLPVSRRTPVASYITMAARVKHVAKIALPNPSVMPTIKARETTKEVWEEGMPPEPTSRRQFQCFSTNA